MHYYTYHFNSLHPDKFLHCTIYYDNFHFNILNTDKFLYCTIYYDAFHFHTLNHAKSYSRAKVAPSNLFHCSAEPRQCLISFIFRASHQ